MSTSDPNSDFTVDVERSEGPLRGFPPKKTTPHDLREDTVTVKSLDAEAFAARQGLPLNQNSLTGSLPDVATLTRLANELFR